MADNRELFEEVEGGVILRVSVIPGAGETRAVGRHGDALKIRVAANPEKGRANEAARVFLAESFGVETGAVEVESGVTSRRKRFKIGGIDAETAESRLDAITRADRASKRRR